ncbi:MAG TPA: zinc ABC transporter substrate-binding protein [Flexivirga sp.]|uniref:metal ABC transporter solute-binding protein, Zn/Mn family n=1 Tax=Flexivirga sp. TaxID=1962927 RepID=UPI002C36AE07|nr:zinc ABC transporter substrate-binding protein [Flexivirga sp.]HWC22522.1 zinc ABC transporter substrate-binding protein [Flexivirga sp.]
MHLRWVAAAVAPVFVLAGCGSSKASGESDGRIGVVASTNVYGDIVKQIGGSHVDVTSVLTDPNVDPHGYESNAKNAASVYDARLIVQNGLGYDSFMAELTSASKSRGQTVITASEVLNIKGADANPHLWYDVAKMPRVADAIAGALSKADSKHSDEYRKNATKFKKSLQPIEKVLAAIKAKDDGAKVAYTERVAGYLLTEAGLQLGIPAGFTRAVEDGDDPSPRDTLAFDKALQKHTVRALVYNSQVTDKQTDQLKKQATSAGVPLVPVTETMPPKSASYQAWQLKQAEALRTALEKSA